MDEIRVGDTVEYCWEIYRKFNGTRGTVVDLIHGNPNSYIHNGCEYKTRYFVDWEKGSSLWKTDNLKEFWNFTVRKISVSYDPNQCGDMDEDI